MTPADHDALHPAMYRPSCPACDARYERLHGRSES